MFSARDGSEGVEAIKKDTSFDCILMDIQCVLLVIGRAASVYVYFLSRMPILNGFEAAKAIRESSSPVASPESGAKPLRRSRYLNGGRMPIFAVSASLLERQRGEMLNYGMDGWILKPIDFKRLRKLLAGINSPKERNSAVYRPGCNWEEGGWFCPSEVV